MNLTETSTFIVIDNNESIVRGEYNVFSSADSVVIKDLNGQVIKSFNINNVTINGNVVSVSELFLFFIANISGESESEL